jgi:hypothetical protein
MGYRTEGKFVIQNKPINLCRHVVRYTTEVAYFGCTSLLCIIKCDNPHYVLPFTIIKCGPLEHKLEKFTVAITEFYYCICLWYYQYTTMKQT